MLKLASLKSSMLNKAFVYLRLSWKHSNDWIVDFECIYLCLDSYCAVDGADGVGCGAVAVYSRIRIVKHTFHYATCLSRCSNVLLRGHAGL